MIKTILLILVTIFRTLAPSPHPHDHTNNPSPTGRCLHRRRLRRRRFNQHRAHNSRKYLQRRSYFPGHIHAFYVEYIYYKRRDEIRAGTYDGSHASGIYSQKVQHGGMTVQPPVQQPAVV